MTTMWFDESNTRRGVLDADSYQQSLNHAVAALLFLASDGPSTAAAVAAELSIPVRRATILLDRLVTAGGATEDDGTYTGILVEDA